MDWKLGLGIGAAAVAYFVGNYTSIGQIWPDEIIMDGPVLSYQSFVFIVRSVTQETYQKISTLNTEFKKERLEVYSKDFIKYREIIEKYLFRQEEIIQQTYAEALKRFGVSERVFEDSISTYHLKPEFPSVLNPKSEINKNPSPMKESEYIELLKAKYTVLLEASETLENRRISPIDFIELEFKLMDEVEANSSYTEDDMAKAQKRFYHSQEVRTLLELINERRRQLVPNSSINFNY